MISHIRSRVSFDAIKNKSWMVAGRRIGLTQAIGLGVVPLMEYHFARSEGRGVMYSMGKAAIWGGALLVAPSAAILRSMAMQTAPALTQGGYMAYRNKQSALKKAVKPFSPDFRDNPFAMRERYMLQQEAMSSYGRARSIFGREASLMSRRYG